MTEPDIPGIHAPLRAYLELAQEYYTQDKLDVAMAVVEDAFQETGWPAGTWTAFYNELVCENDARNASDLNPVDEKLSIEFPRTEPAVALEQLRAIAIEARAVIGKQLGVEYLRPVMITVFLPDAAVDFIMGSHGYVSHKSDLDKICLPYQALQSGQRTKDTLVHEFSHVGLFELSAGKTERWLNEGLATYTCGDLFIAEAQLLIRQAVEDRKLLSISALEGVLSSTALKKSDPEIIATAYFLSGTFLAWWVERKGLESVREALVLMGRGMGQRRAIGRAAGMSLRQMEQQWRGFMEGGSWQSEFSRIGE